MKKYRLLRLSWAIYVKNLPDVEATEVCERSQSSAQRSQRTQRFAQRVIKEKAA
jgi:hypothetical protein